MPNLRHYDNTGSARFVTLISHQRLKLFVRSEIVDCFLRELEAWRVSNEIDIFGWVVMPEHVHLVLFPRAAILLGPVLGQLKSQSARLMLPLLNQAAVDKFLSVHRSGEVRRVFWTRRAYDHNCRTPEAVLQKIEYCHKNPVRRGLVDDMADWPWSSYHSYKGETNQIVKLAEFVI